MRVVALAAPITIWLNGSVIRLFSLRDGEWELLEEQGSTGDLVLSQLAPGGRGRAIFDSIAHAIPLEGPILIAGPDITLYHFRAFLDEQYPQAARRVTGYEMADRWPKLGAR